MGSGVIRKGNGGQNLRPEPALLHPVTALKIDRPGRRDRRGRAPWPCLVTLWLEQGLGEMKLEGFVGQIDLQRHQKSTRPVPTHDGLPQTWSYFHASPQDGPACASRHLHIMSGHPKSSAFPLRVGHFSLSSLPSSSSRAAALISYVEVRCKSHICPPPPAKASSLC